MTLKRTSGILRRMEPEMITLNELRQEIRDYGISRLARDTGFSRQHIQRIAGGQRTPGPDFLYLFGYEPVTLFKDILDDEPEPPQ